MKKKKKKKKFQQGGGLNFVLNLIPSSSTAKIAILESLGMFWSPNRNPLEAAPKSKMILLWILQCSFGSCLVGLYLNLYFFVKLFALEDSGDFRWKVGKTSLGFVNRFSSPCRINEGRRPYRVAILGYVDVGRDVSYLLSVLWIQLANMQRSVFDSFSLNWTYSQVQIVGARSPKSYSFGTTRLGPQFSFWSFLLCWVPTRDIFGLGRGLVLSHQAKMVSTNFAIVDYRWLFLVPQLVNTHEERSFISRFIWTIFQRRVSIFMGQQDYLTESRSSNPKLLLLNLFWCRVFTLIGFGMGRDAEVGGNVNVETRAQLCTFQELLLLQKCQIGAIEYKYSGTGTIFWCKVLQDLFGANIFDAYKWDGNNSSLFRWTSRISSSFPTSMGSERVEDSVVIFKLDGWFSQQVSGAVRVFGPFMGRFCLLYSFSPVFLSWFVLFKSSVAGRDLHPYSWFFCTFTRNVSMRYLHWWLLFFNLSTTTGMWGLLLTPRFVRAVYGWTFNPTYDSIGRLLLWVAGRDGLFFKVQGLGSVFGSLFLCLLKLTKEKVRETGVSGLMGLAEAGMILKVSTFIEQLVEDESQMEGFSDDCSRIMVWHLPLEASLSMYPSQWLMKKNLDVISPPT